MALCYISPREHGSPSFICSLGQHLSDSGVQALSPDSELWVAVGAATRRTKVPVLNNHVPTEGKMGALLHPPPGAQLTPGRLGPGRGAALDTQGGQHACLIAPERSACPHAVRVHLELPTGPAPWPAPAQLSNRRNCSRRKRWGPGRERMNASFASLKGWWWFS